MSERRYRRRRRVRRFVAGSLLGGIVVALAPIARRRAPVARDGLDAFADLPCAAATPEGDLPE